MFKFGTQNYLLGTFWAGTLTNYCHIWTRINLSKFGTKNALFGCFWASVWKGYCHIWNQEPRICLNVNFQANKEILKFGTKNSLL